MTVAPLEAIADERPRGLFDAPSDDAPNSEPGSDRAAFDTTDPNDEDGDPRGLCLLGDGGSRALLVAHAEGERLLVVEPEPLRPALRGRLAATLEAAIEERLERLGAPPAGISARDLDASLSDQLYRLRKAGRRGLLLCVPELLPIANLAGALDAEDSAVLRWWIAATSERPVQLLFHQSDRYRGVYAAPTSLQAIVAQRVFSPAPNAAPLEPVADALHTELEPVAEALPTPDAPEPTATEDDREHVVAVAPEASVAPDADELPAESIAGVDAPAEAEAADAQHLDHLEIDLSADPPQAAPSLETADVEAAEAEAAVAESAETESAMAEAVEGDAAEAGAAMSEDAVSEDAVSEGAVSEGAVSEGAATEGAATEAAEGEDPKGEVVETESTAPIASQTARAMAALFEDAPLPTVTAEPIANRASPPAPQPEAPPPAAPQPIELEPLAPKAVRRASAEDCARWVRELEGVRGPKPLSLVERTFVSAYVPLAEAVARGDGDARARKALETWAASFDKSYSDAFDALRLRGKRPNMVLDVPDLALRLGRLHGARSVQLLLVDGLRFDLGMRVEQSLCRRLPDRAALTERLLLWSALPTTTSTQLELLGRGPEGLREPLGAPDSEPPVARGRGASVIRRVKTGHRELFKLDLVEARLNEPGPAAEERLSDLAGEISNVLAEHFLRLPPRTLVMVFGDHGFLLDAHDSGTSAARQGGASPEEVLVPAMAWLVGAVH